MGTIDFDRTMVDPWFAGLLGQPMACKIHMDLAAWFNGFAIACQGARCYREPEKKRTPNKEAN